MTVSLVIIEGLVMCFDLVMVCVVLIANGAVGGVIFYGKDVQERVVELGLITRGEMRRRLAAAGFALLVPALVLAPLAVYFVNGARDFWESFLQLTAIYLIMGSFDRIFIDWFWVCKTKAWIIPGTEDMMPYVTKKDLLIKWIVTVVGYPLYAALAAWIITLINGG